MRTPRRRAVLMAFGAVAAGAAAQAAGAAAALGLGAARLVAPTSPLVFHSPPLEPFVDELPVPARLTGSALVLDARSATHRFHRDLPSGPTFAYGGNDYLGPTIEANADQPLELTMRNRLGRHVFAADVDTTLHGALEFDRAAPRTVLHLHGGATPPDSDGHPESGVAPGGEVVHRYPNRQEAATLWYHDHQMGLTRLNVMAGLAGLYLLRDRWDTGLPGNPLGLPSGDHEVPLVLQERILTPSGAINARSTLVVPRGSWEGGAVGDVGVVNGAVWPRLTVDRGLYRFRVVNAGSYSVWSLYLSGRRPFWVIGTDGGLLDAPARVTALRLAPGERADLLVDFSGLGVGDVVDLCNDEPAPGQAAVLGERTMPLFCRFVAGGSTGFRGPVPDRLRGGAGLPPRLPPPPSPQRVRTVSVSQLLDARLPPAFMVLNNLRYTDGDVELPRQGTVERWDIVNTTADPHPVHLHLVRFRVLSRRTVDVDLLRLLHPVPALGRRWAPAVGPAVLRGSERPAPPEEAGWKDVVRTDPKSVTRVLVQVPSSDELGFDPDAAFLPPPPTRALAAALAADRHHGALADPTRPLRGYVWHCHILDHEDHEMMLPLRFPAS